MFKQDNKYTWALKNGKWPTPLGWDCFHDCICDHKSVLLLVRQQEELETMPPLNMGNPSCFIRENCSL